ncbi:MAG: tRNA 2-thiouridine(34) synthase MnmA [Oscillospiraceae bacterium]|nr:tRNA 2-thiouridine(34) synthase MnmA [Oscillospiraceae bacterium]
MKALIAMSGGVDSAVAAYLMQRSGWDCIGCTMKLFQNEDAGVAREKTCCALDDVEDARAVAFRMGIPHYVFNFSDEFREKVIEKFIRAYQQGRTPNPCIDCNHYLKFSKLYHRARELGCDAVVTGHYARIEEENGLWRLKKALDPDKDQSYVLYHLNQEQLAHTRFPLGGMTKTETRALAEAQGFVNARKPDSQDICFVPDGDYARVIELRTGQIPPPGDFVDCAGHVLGRHRGILHYTVGQRRGLGLSFDQPYYVVRIDAAANTVTLGPKEALFSRTALVENFHWIAGQPPAAPIRCAVKIRYRHSEQPCLLTPLEGGRVRLDFDTPQRAVTPGQSAVAYDGDAVLGGGELASELLSR